MGQEREVFVPPFEWQYYVTLLPTCFSFFSFSCSDGLKNKSFLPLNSACLINLPVALLVEMFSRQFKVNSATSGLKQPFGASSLLILDSYLPPKFSHILGWYKFGAWAASILSRIVLSINPSCLDYISCSVNIEQLTNRLFGLGSGRLDSGTPQMNSHLPSLLLFLRGSPLEAWPQYLPICSNQNPSIRLRSQPLGPCQVWLSFPPDWCKVYGL